MDNKKVDSNFPFGFSLADANAIFELALESCEMGDNPVIGVDGETVGDFCDPHGWLAPWMRQSDEISSILFNKKLWDVEYVATGDSMEGMVVRRPSADASPMAWMKLADVPWSIRFLIARTALIYCMDTRAGYSRLKEALLLLGKKVNEIEEGDILKDAATDELFVSHFMRFLERTRGSNVSRSRNRDVELT